MALHYATIVGLKFDDFEESLPWSAIAPTASENLVNGALQRDASPGCRTVPIVERTS
jgi:hypothetical protein